LFQGLAAAENYADSTIESSLGLGRDELVVFLQDYTTLRVSEECPGNVAVLELIDGDLTGEGTVGLVEDVLCCDLKTGLEVLAGEEEVERWRRDDDLCRPLITLTTIFESIFALIH